MSDGGWVLLGPRPEEEIALGLVGKFWRPVIEYAQVDAATFKEFAEPGFAKTIYALGTRPTEEGKTLLSAIMRTASTDEPARTWFRRYWNFGVGYGAHVLVHGLLDVVREGRRTSERNLTSAPAPGHTRQRRERTSRMSKAPTAIRTHWLALAASELRPPPSSRAAKKLSY